MNKVVAVFWDNEYEVWSTEGVKIIDTIVMDNNLVNVNYYLLYYYFLVCI